jgi:hypothetical protein
MEPTSELVAIGAYELQMHSWRPAAPATRPRAVAVVYHGFLVRSSPGFLVADVPPDLWLSVPRAVPNSRLPSSLLV